MVGMTIKTMPLSKSIKKLPQTPGVYIYRDKAGKIIYVGKAVNLRRRVSDYFRGAKDGKTTLLVAEIATIEHRETPSALEAMILEANLIKKHQPIYNIKEKDDKSYLFLWISRGDWPRVATVRATDLHQIPEKNPRLFGPYTSGAALKSALEIIRPIIPYRSCRVLPKKKCLYGHLGLCPAPCEGLISANDYRLSINYLSAFFRGSKRTIVQELKREMRVAAKNKNYEVAAILRDKVRSLEHIKDIAVLSRDDRPTIYGRIEGYDISNIQGASATGSMVVYVEGSAEKSEYRKFRVKNVAGANDIAMLSEVLTRRLRHKEWPMPDLIIIDGGEGQINMAAKALAVAGISNIPLVAIAKGPQRKKDDFRFRGRVPQRDLKLFKQVRDESHRFAIGYYRRLHRKRLMPKSKLKMPNK